MGFYSTTHCNYIIYICKNAHNNKLIYTIYKRCGRMPVESYMETQTSKIMRCAMCMTKENESLIRSIFDCVFYTISRSYTCIYGSFLDYPQQQQNTFCMKTRKRQPYASKTINVKQSKCKIWNFKKLLFAQSVMVVLVHIVVVVFGRFLFRFLFLLFFEFYFQIISHNFVQNVIAGPEKFIFP